MRAIWWFASLMAGGAILRVWRYAQDWSFWSDEAALATNVVRLNYVEFLNQPLPHFEQAAPVGFLWIAKMVSQVVGTSDAALRLPVLLAGLLSLPVFYVLARRALSQRGAIAALALFSCSEAAVYFSMDFKQYGFDLALGLLMVYLFVRCHEKSVSGTWMAILIVTGMTSVWFSHPVAFVTAGLGGVMIVRSFALASGKFGEVVQSLGVHHSVPGDGTLIRWVVVCGLIGISFVLMYGAVAHSISESDYYQRLWSNAYLVFPTSMGDIINNSKAILRLFADLYGTYNVPEIPVLGHYMTGLTFALFVLGAISTYYTRRLWFFFLMAPIAVTAIVSFAKLYPFAGRLVLFLHPFLWIFIAKGVEFCWQGLQDPRATVAVDRQESPGSERSGLAGSVLFAILIVTAVSKVVVFHSLKAPGRQEVETTLIYVLENAEPNDLVIFYPRMSRPAIYYVQHTKQFDFNQFDVYDKSLDEWPSFENLFDAIEARSRVWFLISHPSGDEMTIKNETLLAHLKRKGRVVREGGVPVMIDAVGARAYLFDFTAGGTIQSLPEDVQSPDARLVDPAISVSLFRDAHAGHNHPAAGDVMAGL